jgi:N-acetylglucosamine kinase-like BadF-type ATPase
MSAVMPAQRLLLGVDGGASKTIALIADEAGTVRGAGRAGSSDIHGTSGPAVAVVQVVDAVRGACASAGVEPGDLAAGAFCLCGADWPEDDDYFAATLGEQLGLAVRPVVMNDAFAALRAGAPDGVGVTLVLGTGVGVAARGPSGRTWFSGFRIESAGAVELGRQVYEQLIRGAFGPGPVPSFRSAALEVFGVEDVESLVHAISRVDSSSQQNLARLAPVLLEAGHRGDATARSIVHEHGLMLAGYVRAAAQRVGLDETDSTVILGGGLLRHHCTDLVAAVVEGLPGCRVAQVAVEPVFGALLMAADVAGASPSLGRLRGSSPDAAFFRTL